MKTLKVIVHISTMIFFMYTEQVRWSSLLHHVLNEHQWVTGSCDHEVFNGPPIDSNGKELQYFIRNEPAFQALQKLVLDKTWLKSLKYCQILVSTRYQYQHVYYFIICIHTTDTGNLECFNNIVLAYSPKRAAFQ